jgi:hypothetical protein
LPAIGFGQTIEALQEPRVASAGRRRIFAPIGARASPLQRPTGQDGAAAFDLQFQQTLVSSPARSLRLLG